MTTAAVGFGTGGMNAETLIDVGDGVDRFDDSPR
jgi:hypothetical protein